MHEHQHEFKHTGGGTDLINKISDVSYECECGARMTTYMDTDDYLDRKYPKTILCRISFPKTIKE